MTISTNFRLPSETRSSSAIIPLGLLATLALLAGCNGGHGAGGGAGSWSHGDGSKFGWIEVDDGHVEAEFFQASRPPYDDNVFAGGCAATVTNGEIGTAVGAGALTFTVAGQAPFTFAPTRPDLYSVGHDFPLGQLTVHAAGDTVPAFDTEVTPSAPSSVQMLQPPLGVGSAPDVSRTRDLSLVWKAGTSGTLILNILSDGWNVVCAFPAADGHGTVPSTVLAVLPVDKLLVLGQIADLTRFNAGDWQLSLVRWRQAGILGCGTDCEINLQP